MKTIRLSPKEVSRASGGIAIISRPQAGSIRVLAVRVQGTRGVALQSKCFEATVENKAGVGPAAKEIARWLSKLGYDCPMAEASRDRNFCRS